MAITSRAQANKILADAKAKKEARLAAANPVESPKEEAKEAEKSSIEIKEGAKK